MLYSIANLLVVKVASSNPQQDVINGVHFDEDGATVATDGHTMLAVEPVPETVRFPAVGDRAVPGNGGVTLDVDIVEQAIKNIPRQNRPEMQFAVMTRNDSAGRVELTTTDLRKEQRVSGERKRGRFPKWRDFFKKAHDGSKYRVCVDRRRLAQLLQVMDDAAGGSRDPRPVVYIDFGGPHDFLLVRGVNHTTGQQILGVVMPVDTRGYWLKLSVWVQRVLGRGIEAKKAMPERMK